MINTTLGGAGLQQRIMEQQLQAQYAQSGVQLDQTNSQLNEYMEAKSMIDQYNADPTQFGEAERAYVKQLAPALGMSIAEGNSLDKKPGFLDFSFGKNNKGGGAQGLLGGVLDSLLFDLIPDNAYTNRHNRGWATGGKWAGTIGSLAYGVGGAIKGVQAAKMAKTALAAKTALGVSDDLAKGARALVMSNSDEVAKILGVSVDELPKMFANSSYDDIMAAFSGQRSKLAKELAELRSWRGSINNKLGQISKLTPKARRQKLLTYSDDVLEPTIINADNVGGKVVDDFIPDPNTVYVDPNGNAVLPSMATNRAPVSRQLNGPSQNTRSLVLYKGPKRVLKGKEVPNWHADTPFSSRAMSPVDRTPIPFERSLVPGSKPRAPGHISGVEDLREARKVINSRIKAAQELSAKTSSFRKQFTALQKEVGTKWANEATTIGKQTPRALLKEIETKQEVISQQIDDVRIALKGDYSQAAFRKLEALRKELAALEESKKTISKLSLLKDKASGLGKYLTAPSSARSMANNFANFGALTTGGKVKQVMFALPQMVMITQSARSAMTPPTIPQLAAGSWGGYENMFNPAAIQQKMSYLPFNGALPPMNKGQGQVDEMLNQ